MSKSENCDLNWEDPGSLEAYARNLVERAQNERYLLTRMMQFTAAAFYFELSTKIRKSRIGSITTELDDITPEIREELIQIRQLDENGKNLHSLIDIMRAEIYHPKR